MPRPLLRMPRVIVGLTAGGMSLSKSSLRRAEAPGVLPATGVRFHGPCAGLGLQLTKSAKLKFMPGVLGPKPKNPFPPVPGVMWDEGRGVDLHGGVEGAWITVLAPEVRTAGDGEVARYMSRSAPSSSALGVRDQET
jgi:hypothetical protein